MSESAVRSIVASEFQKTPQFKQPTATSFDRGILFEFTPYDGNADELAVEFRHGVVQSVKFMPD
jgi:hypothetical protein